MRIENGSHFDSHFMGLILSRIVENGVPDFADFVAAAAAIQGKIAPLSSITGFLKVGGVGGAGTDKSCQPQPFMFGDGGMAVSQVCRRLFSGQCWRQRFLVVSFEFPDKIKIKLIVTGYIVE